jgi:hypothetical protein
VAGELLPGRVAIGEGVRLERKAMKRSLSFLLAILSLYSAAWATEDAFQRLSTAKSLKCQLGRGAVGDWKTGKLIVREDTFDVTLHFDAINLKARTARFIANAGAGDVSVALTAAGLTFIEETGMGNLAIATVFAQYQKNTRDFIVVYSRHLSFFEFGSPLPSQYHGTCKVWE